MKLERKCKCPSNSHGHKPGKCDSLATEPDELCETCRGKTAEELPTIRTPAAGPPLETRAEVKRAKWSVAEATRIASNIAKLPDLLNR
jgi:hypothetical protein